MVVPHLFLAILTLTTFTPCTTADSLNSFEHIVIFMQENRAFGKLNKHPTRRPTPHPPHPPHARV